MKKPRYKREDNSRDFSLEEKIKELKDYQEDFVSAWGLQRYASLLLDLEKQKQEQDRGKGN